MTSPDTPQPATPPSAAPDPAVQEAIRGEQLRMVWAHSRGGIVAATLFAVVLAIYAAGRVPIALVGAWLALKLLVAAIRLMQSVRFVHEGQPGDRRWRQATYRMLTVDGLVWGAGGAYMVGLSTEAASLIVACLIGISCVATFGLQVRALATAAYVTPILAPTALGLMLRLDAQGLVQGLGALVVLAVQLRTAVQSERRFAEVHHLRMRADAHAAERRDALELAQRESAAKSTFLSSVSHELRTPLHGVLGIARLLHSEVGSTALKRRVELIESSGSHLLRLVNDLIDVARTHTDRLPLRPRRFDLVYELEALMGIYSVRAADKSIGFNSFIRIAGPCWVMGDSARMRQVLHNVLGNAIKYTDVHGAITCTAHHTREVLKIEVRDTGVGIAEEDQERMFSAFSRADGIAKRSEGAGLGLTIAREVARAMGGDIAVQSAVGIGSVFTITLPMQAAVIVAGRVDRELEATEPLPLGPRHVLVVEDDDVSAMVASAALANLGLRVERVSNGAEAVRHALRETERPDLVLMDCRMPVMDGFAATAAIRDQEKALGLSRVPVIACTAEESETLKSECLAKGMDDLLRKPFNSSELYAMLTRWLGADFSASSRMPLMSGH